MGFAARLDSLWNRGRNCPPFCRLGRPLPCQDRFPQAARRLPRSGGAVVRTRAWASIRKDCQRAGGDDADFAIPPARSLRDRFDSTGFHRGRHSRCGPRLEPEFPERDLRCEGSGRRGDLRRGWNTAPLSVPAAERIEEVRRARRLLERAGISAGFRRRVCTWTRGLSKSIARDARRAVGGSESKREGHARWMPPLVAFARRVEGRFLAPAEGLAARNSILTVPLLVARLAGCAPRARRGPRDLRHRRRLRAGRPGGGRRGQGSLLRERESLERPFDAARDGLPPQAALVSLA